ncbi:4-hydroxybenzoate polyprenyltransferase [Haloferula luteola]|uniref:4-hydroxybenzoate polyprenyltransferase n=1 Tax=Haloferula luteola TaxID=595692 RepID=A0A840V2M5_9BACT|nr:UbiA family prenyltransferase [Haloferula luteola]MBB5352242.1 4-hydroxybenzoate polyprenyltransferase [Haloferula luteola]
MRWWTYQKERFPVVAHGLLIAVFSACAVSYSALLRDGVPRAPSFGVAFGVCFLFFLQLRIADEFKDAEEDARWRPYRPVPRGLITLRELGWGFAAAAVVQCGLAVAWEPGLLWVLGGGWAYLGGMSVEFFARKWLKARPVVYLLTHMGIMPLVDFFATACDWIPAGEKPGGLGPFLAASFCNGLVIELGRKLRQPAAEEEGVETYSRLWGMRWGVRAWWVSQGMTAIFAGWAAAKIGFAGPTWLALGSVGVLSYGVGWRFQNRSLNGSWIERVSALWTLVLYLVMGVVPWWLKVGVGR